jgi:glycosyltransferase involved in cell wall biosynthesis
MAIEISIIICTFDRPDFVTRAIGSVFNQSIDAAEYEIVVIDNGTTDETKKVINKKFRRHNNLRYLRLREPGLSRARNAGIDQSRGAILAFLDDDAIACHGWLRAIVAAFGKSNRPPGLVCGPVEPDWGAPRPAWLHDEFLGVYSLVNWSQTPRPLDPTEWIVGANFAVRRDVMQECGPFDTQVGRKGQSLLSGEETLLTKRIRSAGYPIFYDPAISIKHHIHGERLNKQWFYRRLFWGAASRGLLDRDSSSGFAASSSYIYEIAKRIARQLFRSFSHALAADSRFRWTRVMAKDLGLLYGYLWLRTDGN